MCRRCLALSFADYILFSIHPFNIAMEIFVCALKSASCFRQLFVYSIAAGDFVSSKIIPVFFWID